MLSYPTTWVPPQRSTVPPNQPERHVEFIPGTRWEISAHDSKGRQQHAVGTYNLVRIFF